MENLEPITQQVLKIEDVKPYCPYESSELNELFAALSKAQGDIEIAKTDSVNPFYKSKYADLAQIIKASRPYLASNGLSIIQRVLTNGNNQMYLFTRLCHASGQWIEAKMPINPPKSDIQSLGSYITYLRRYNWASVVGVAASDEDDDGNNAVESQKQEKTPQYITINQMNELEDLLDKLPVDEKSKLLKWCQVEEIQFIPKYKFSAAKKALEAKVTKGGE